MKQDIEYQAEMLANKTRHYLITDAGCILNEANNSDIYLALSHALREEILINWLATSRTIKKNDSRILYYMSLEYLPGRIFSNNITNLNASDVVKLACLKLNRNYTELLDCEHDPGLGNGGLGRLASCFMDSLATLHYPSQGYGLRYQYGIFEQQIWGGEQIEAPDCWLINENPWEFRRDLDRVTIQYGGDITTESNIHGDEIYKLNHFEEVWANPFDIPIVGYSNHNKFSVCPLRLWSTKESPRNFQLQRYNAGRLDQAAENTTLTDVLYPSDQHAVGKRVRLKQEYLLVSASVQDIIKNYLSNHDNFRSFADKVRIQINDTHPALTIAELIRLLTSKYDLPWKMAVDIARECTGYTNHTILSEALEVWESELMMLLLPRQYKIIERLNYEFCMMMRSQHHADEEKIRRMSIIEENKVRMANLSIIGSHKVNGVAELHTEILKNVVFKDFAETYPDKFVNITNGVTQRRWLKHCNSDLASLISLKIGDDWITDFPQIRKLEKFAEDPDFQQDVLRIKRKNKFKLIEYIKNDNKIRDSRGQLSESAPIIDVESLFDVQIKRIHEYKRQLLNILHVIMLYQEMSGDPNHQRAKRTVIFGGKAAASYETAKDIIRLITCVARKINKDPNVQGHLKVIYIENYNVSKARIIIPAADLSEQISTAGYEASGTGNMKLAINGALTIGTDDGANIEMRQQIGDQWWPFLFGASAEEIKRLRESGHYQPWEIYERNPKIKRALDSLINNTFAENELEHKIFSKIFYHLIERTYGAIPDKYFILHDLENYCQIQNKVDALFENPLKWAEYTIHNIAGMGNFSSDVTIKKYNELIWGLKETPSDSEILEQVRDEYSKHDICRIY